MQEPLSIAVIGCGSRGRTYARIAVDLGHRITAFADPSPSARQAMEEIAGPDAQAFSDADGLLAAPKLARVAAICTQDSQHFPQAVAAIHQGYDLLLEKPAACSSADVDELSRLAEAEGCRIILCFVLRYTPFYRTLKSQLDAGIIGDIISIQAAEGVGPWHQAHSFVRGHWSRSKNSTPMIVAKCSHDTDLLAWLADSPCRSVASFAGQSHFTPGMAPTGAPERCTDGCPHLGTCRFDAHRYLTDQRRWLQMVRPDADSLGDAAIIDWLKTSDWGRCVYHCGQDTPDHQVVSMQFASGITADLTMTAFDTGRRIRIYGTQGILEGAMHADGRDPWIECRMHEGETTALEIVEQDTGGYQGHGGGDFGLIEALPALLDADAADSRQFTEGHRIAFAAARAAEQDCLINLAPDH
ncbi:Gfo/Idh/MocA family protein [Haloferula rosea]|uniref:Gfo/Idh/MocA family oxidoreductase n=1 Tax=Haloferula rosea TaxID=490093 RepID=A0A934RH05_9BACT|nr:Gfo/Idh/MocA family oxidoreductase [Haloferula rosea]MBK1828999.1 Gfo/Idh/MocA family oxidoreductase [Haloferula rosea]